MESGFVRRDFLEDLRRQLLALLRFAHAQKGQRLQGFGASVVSLLLQHFVRLVHRLLVGTRVQVVWGRRRSRGQGVRKRGVVRRKGRVKGPGSEEAGSGGVG